MKAEIPYNVALSIEREIEYQMERWGDNKEQSLPGYLVIMRQILNDAEQAWLANNFTHRESPLEEMVKVVATGIVCLSQYGTFGSAKATNDE